MHVTCYECSALAVQAIKTFISNKLKCKKHTGTFNKKKKQ